MLPVLLVEKLLPLEALLSCPLVGVLLRGDFIPYALAAHSSMLGFPPLVGVLFRGDFNTEAPANAPTTFQGSLCS